MVRLLVLMTLTLGRELSAQVHTAPRYQASASGECVGTLKAYKVRRDHILYCYANIKARKISDSDSFMNNEGV